MEVDTGQRTKIKHVKRRDSSGMKEYWKDVEVSILLPGEVPPEPENPLPPPGAEGATKSKPLHKPKDVGYQHWQDEDS